jgi:16S rRNA processing protein RimM
MGRIVPERLTVADIVGVYGVKGWVKLRSRLENPEVLKGLAGVQIVSGPQQSRQLDPIAACVDAMREQGKGLIAHFAGIDDRDQAEALRGRVLTMAAASLPAAADDEVYWRDLIDLTVWCRARDRAGELVCLGQVHYLLETGANDVVVVKPNPDSIDARERLIPWLPGVTVVEIDLVGGLLTMDWYVAVD